MSELENLIQITITRQTSSVATAAFNIPAILAQFTDFSERTRVYTSISAVGEDFDSTSDVYIIANKMFGQSSVAAVPPSIVVGRRQVDSVVGTVTTATEGVTYTVTINGTDYSYVAVALDDATDIVAGIKAAYDLAAISGITFTDNLDGTFDVAVSVAGTAWSITSSNLITLVQDTPTETWTEALEAMEVENNDWYGLVLASHVQADQEEIATAITARKKIYGTSTSNAVTPTTGTTDVASSFYADTLGRVYTIYQPEADSDWPEAAAMGGYMPYTPGSASWNVKQLVGVTVYSLTDTQRANLRNKNCNFYTRVGGLSILQDGLMADGRPIYEIMTADWIESRMRERIYAKWANSLKFTYDRRGFALIGNEMRGVLAEAVNNNAISSFEVFEPDPLAASVTDKADGIARTFTFRAVILTDIRKVIIEGTLTL